MGKAKSTPKKSPADDGAAESAKRKSVPSSTVGDTAPSPPKAAKLAPYLIQKSPTTRPNNEFFKRAMVASMPENLRLYVNEAVSGFTKFRALRIVTTSGGDVYIHGRACYIVHQSLGLWKERAMTRHDDEFRASKFLPWEDNTSGVPAYIMRSHQAMRDYQLSINSPLLNRDSANNCIRILLEIAFCISAPLFFPTNFWDILTKAGAGESTRKFGATDGKSYAGICPDVVKTFGEHILGLNSDDEGATCWIQYRMAALLAHSALAANPGLEYAHHMPATQAVHATRRKLDDYAESNPADDRCKNLREGSLGGFFRRVTGDVDSDTQYVVTEAGLILPSTKPHDPVEATAVATATAAAAMAASSSTLA